MLKKIKLVHILIAIITITVVFAAFLFLKPKAVGNTELGATITTKAGDLKLEYKNGTAILSGELARSTPCVDWQVKTNSSSGTATFEIADSNKGAICVQALGLPQAIDSEIKTSASSYVVTMEGETLFSGKLNSVPSAPEAPTSGTVSMN